ncbi:signal transduction histidine kinase [Marinilabilia salmonicolor]|jgi:signal transduction histidine kinase|uniref:histidine kinase n=2 Tax=Marinilabilia salmonicolor TaxID=989 RepID=A0A2T0XH63_9BACT|nr:signal transduction histidine kinase [Marinilabilia salmonicolor]RCW29225.1 signal transduction histidine kinase [Marinilabilia salmonicolor]
MLKDQTATTKTIPNMKKQIKPISKSDKLRQAAELLVNKKESGHKPSLSVSETLKIIHELEIHQLELEMQNEELKKAREKAEENERLKSSFLANMSHEIRTPMNGILGFTQILKTFEMNEEERQNYIEIIEKSGIRMLNIINDIISISKIESQQVEISIAETNINEQVEYIYHFFKLEAEQKKLNLSFKNDLPDEKAFFRTDREKVYAILTNLVKNAIKFTPTGSVELGYSLKDDFIEFFVRDSGPGIPKDQQEIIFGRFIQGTRKLSQNYEGSGLGLSISKAYTEMLGGKIRVENNASHNGNGAGSTFFFTISAIPFNPPKSINRNENPGKKINDKARGLNILIVEDDKISRMLLNTMVKDLSKNIFNATNGIEAVNVCRNNPEIDLVLMDINIPKRNGYEATREIRGFNRKVKIIAQTAYALEGDREKSIAVGCNNYVSKPINRTGLRSMISGYFPKLTKA